MFKILKRFHKPKRNSLYLIGDGDDIDILEDVERTFEIQISNREAETVETVGDLESLIVRKRNNPKETEFLWKLLCRIAAENARYTIDPNNVNRETTFFTED